MMAAIRRTGFMRILTARHISLDTRIVVKRSTVTIVDGSAGTAFAAVAVLPASVEEKGNSGSRKTEGDQQAVNTAIAILLSYDADVRVEDRLVINANITSLAPITYTGGNELTVTHVGDADSQATFISVTCVKPSVKK